MSAAARERSTPRPSTRRCARRWHDSASSTTQPRRSRSVARATLSGRALRSDRAEAAAAHPGPGRARRRGPRAAAPPRGRGGPSARWRPGTGRARGTRRRRPGRRRRRVAHHVVALVEPAEQRPARRHALGGAGGAVSGGRGGRPRPGGRRRRSPRRRPRPLRRGTARSAGRRRRRGRARGGSGRAPRERTRTAWPDDAPRRGVPGLRRATPDDATRWTPIAACTRCTGRWRRAPGPLPRGPTFDPTLPITAVHRCAAPHRDVRIAARTRGVVHSAEDGASARAGAPPGAATRRRRARSRTHDRRCRRAPRVRSGRAGARDVDDHAVVLGGRAPRAHPELDHRVGIPALELADEVGRAGRRVHEPVDRPGVDDGAVLNRIPRSPAPGCRVSRRTGRSRRAPSSRRPSPRAPWRRECSTGGGPSRCGGAGSSRTCSRPRRRCSGWLAGR